MKEHHYFLIRGIVALNKDKPVCVNVDFQNKATPEQAILYSNSFLEREIDRDDLARFVENGFAFTTVYNGTRKKANFVRAGYIALDFDDWNITDCIDHEFTKNAAFLYTTPSHDPIFHKFRLVFELDEIITSAEQYEEVVKGLLNIYSEADTACKDCSRMFYGSVGAKVYKFEGLLTASLVTNLKLQATRYRKSFEIKPYEIKREFKQDREVSEQEVIALLNKIGPMPGYEVWRNCCWALFDHFGSRAYHIINQWSPDDKNGSVIRRLGNSCDGRIKIGTVFYYAK